MPNLGFEAPPPPPGMHWKGGRQHPLTAPSLCPAIFSLTLSASFNGICNRQDPPPTALAASFNPLLNRLCGRL